MEGVVAPALRAASMGVLFGLSSGVRRALRDGCAVPVMGCAAESLSSTWDW